MSGMRNEGAAVDFRDELAELDAQARRGEIALADYFARRAALLPNPAEDPATAPYAAHAAPEPSEPLSPQLAEQLVERPNADTVPPASPDQQPYPDAGNEADDLTMTRPPWHVQNMLAQGQLPPREQLQTPAAWAPEWHSETPT
jgi:hypothetical protein